MTGMKEGAGEDPFAEESAGTEHSKSQSEESNKKPSANEDQPTKDITKDTTETQPSEVGQSIPYKYRRDSVQEGRDRVPLFLQPETKSNEREAIRELEERFDDDVSLTDLREALMKAGLEDLDTTQAHLEQWGYGLDP